MKNNYIYIALIGMSGIIAGAINYAYHPIMLRFMTLENFGIFGSLVGIFNILGVITGGLDLYLNREFSKNLNDKSRLKSLYLSSLILFALFGICIYIFFCILSGYVASYLKVEQYLVLVVGLGLITGFTVISTSALLKAIKKFQVISILHVFEPLFKLGLGVLLVFLGYDILGSVGGFVIASIVGIIVGLLYTIRYFKNTPTLSTDTKILQVLAENKRDLLHFFFTSVLFAIFMNIDVIIVRNLFSAEDAGIYAGIAVLGKFMIFLLLSIETVYFGQIMEHEKHKVPFHLLKNPLIIMAITVVAGITFNLLFGEFILNILKPELTEYISTYILILGYYSILAFVSFFIKILTGWKCYYVNYISAALSVLLVAIVYIFGSESLEHFALSFIIFGIISVIVLGSIFVYEYRRSRKISIKNMQSKDINTITHM